MEEQKQRLKFTTLRNGKNAWETVQSFADADKQWIAAGILSCVDHCYGLDRLTINWETRELRYANRTDCLQNCNDVVMLAPDSPWSVQDDFSDIAPYLEGLPTGQPENARNAIQEESDRLIAIAKENGQFIPSSEWDTSTAMVKYLSPMSEPTTV